MLMKESSEETRLKQQKQKDINAHVDEKIKLGDNASDANGSC
jgi:hypothetical protein